jgi:predicted dehydrogenase
VPTSEDALVARPRAGSSWAIIGCGQVAPAHVTSLRDAGAELIGAVDPVEQSAASFAARFSVPVWPSVAAMLEDATPDAATVAVPHDAHAAVMTELLSSGVAALSEKPLARTPDECSAIVELEARTGVAVGTILNMRGLAYARALHLAIESRRLTMRRIDIVGELIRRRPGIWQTDPTRAGGGILMEVGIHFLDLCAWWLGVPESGRCVLAGEPVDHSADAELGFANGVQASLRFHAVHDMGRPVKVTITADEGVVEVNGAQVVRGADLIAGPGPPTPDELTAAPTLTPDLPYGEGHVRVIGEAVDLFDRQQRFPVTARDGAMSVALASALYRADRDLTAAVAPFVTPLSS